MEIKFPSCTTGNEEGCLIQVVAPTRIEKLFPNMEEPYILHENLTYDTYKQK